ncbi:MAG: SEL1-like repeat protein [Limisphaerales bacterium]
MAQYDIGQRYELGVGVATNHVEAFKWLSLAAAQGQVDSTKLLLSVEKRIIQRRIESRAKIGE